VQSIDQEELVVGGVRIADPGGIRAIVTAVERSRGGAGGEILGEVLRGIAGTGGRDVRPGAGPSGGISVL